MKNVYILGATGTIGLKSIEVITKYKEKFKVIGISLGFSHQDKHIKIIKELNPLIVCLRDKTLNYEKLFPKIKFVYGDKGLLELAGYPIFGLLVNGLSGSSGLMPTIKAIKSGKDIALANKESLVMAGEIITDLVEKKGVKLIPIDSEHSAIFSALIGEDMLDVESITITASGGAFRDKTLKELENVKKEDALKHPNWQMGFKVTIDSATMVNKGLEIIEAHHLFKLSYDNIHAIMHKESIVHGFVTFKDRSVKAVLASPDMIMPIQYALMFPHHNKCEITPLDLANLKLSFAAIDDKRYPLFKLAYEVGRKKGLYPVVYNAANEAAVELFKREKISFLEITKIVAQAVSEFKDNIKKPTIGEIVATDLVIKRKVFEKYGFCY